MSFNEHSARAFIVAIPQGSWATYGDVADAAGNPSAAQHAGNWLRDSNPPIPFYWRVIDANGEVPLGFVASAVGLPRNPVEARERLMEEGVIFVGQRASKQCLYTVEEWRAAGQPASPLSAAAWQLSELETYVRDRLVELPAELGQLEGTAKTDLSVGDAVAVNQAILGASRSNVPAHIRLGRAYEELSLWDLARTSYKAALRLERSNALARKRLAQLDKKHPPLVLTGDHAVTGGWPRRRAPFGEREVAIPIARAHGPRAIKAIARAGVLRRLVHAWSGSAGVIDRVTALVLAAARLPASVSEAGRIGPLAIGAGCASGRFARPAQRPIASLLSWRGVLYRRFCCDREQR